MDLVKNISGKNIIIFNYNKPKLYFHSNSIILIDTKYYVIGLALSSSILTSLILKHFKSSETY